jgi:hypothetical protein
MGCRLSPSSVNVRAILRRLSGRSNCLATVAAAGRWDRLGWEALKMIMDHRFWDGIRTPYWLLESWHRDAGWPAAARECP